MDNYFIATVVIVRDRSAVDYEDKLSTQHRTKFMDVTITTILRDNKSRGYTNNKPVNYSPSAEIENKPGQKQTNKKRPHTEIDTFASNKEESFLRVDSTGRQKPLAEMAMRGHKKRNCRRKKWIN